MSDAIVIATTPGRSLWLADCMASIRRPVIVLSDFSFELGKVRWVMENTSIDRFMLLHDSMVVKGESFFDMAFAAGPKSVALSDCPTKFGMYLAIYHRDTLTQLDIPVVRDKQHAIELEQSWSKEYAALEPDAPLLFDDFTDAKATGTEIRHGRTNLVLENRWLIKWKGTW